ncbi:MAG: hypothetical protein K2X86_06535 [Cytophagaceae bacterium]|nr:hypothetical protein [Cytophagaceae bacterium]
MKKIYISLILFLSICSTAVSQQYVIDIMAEGTGSNVRTQVGRGYRIENKGESIRIEAWGEDNSVLYDGYILGSATGIHTSNYSIKREIVLNSKPKRIVISQRRWEYTIAGSGTTPTWTTTFNDTKFFPPSPATTLTECVWNTFIGWSGNIKAIVSPTEKRYPQFTDGYNTPLKLNH